MERFHHTVKTTLRIYYMEMQKDRDEAIPLALFAFRDAVQESTGFSPFQLVYGHEVRGLLTMLKEKWLGNNDTPNILEYVVNFKERLYRIYKHSTIAIYIYIYIYYTVYQRRLVFSRRRARHSMSVAIA